MCCATARQTLRTPMFREPEPFGAKTAKKHTDPMRFGFQHGTKQHVQNSLVICATYSKTKKLQLPGWAGVRFFRPGRPAGQISDFPHVARCEFVLFLVTGYGGSGSACGSESASLVAGLVMQLRGLLCSWLLPFFFVPGNRATALVLG